MPICNHFHDRLANNGQITTFRWYHSSTLSCAGSLEPRKLRLGPLESTFNADIYASCLGLSVVNSAQFALEMCLAAQNCQKIHKNLYFIV